MPTLYFVDADTDLPIDGIFPLKDVAILPRVEEQFTIIYDTESREPNDTVFVVTKIEHMFFVYSEDPHKSEQRVTAWVRPVYRSN